MLRRDLKPLVDYVPIIEELFNYINHSYECKNPIVRYAIGKYNSSGEFLRWEIEFYPVMIQVQFISKQNSRSNSQVMQISETATVECLNMRIKASKDYINFWMCKTEKSSKINSSFKGEKLKRIRSNDEPNKSYLNDHTRTIKDSKFTDGCVLEVRELGTKAINPPSKAESTEKANDNSEEIKSIYKVNNSTNNGTNLFMAESMSWN
jgi:hypothetical protein